MGRFESKINTSSESFRKNREDHLELIRAFRDLEGRIEANSLRALPKFRKRGQLLLASGSISCLIAVPPTRTLDALRLQDAR